MKVKETWTEADFEDMCWHDSTITGYLRSLPGFNYTEKIAYDLSLYLC